jgi:hypothetical protein
LLVGDDSSSVCKISPTSYKYLGRADPFKKSVSEYSSSSLPPGCPQKACCPIVGEKPQDLGQLSRIISKPLPLSLADLLPPKQPAPVHLHCEQLSNSNSNCIYSSNVKNFNK